MRYFVILLVSALVKAGVGAEAAGCTGGASNSNGNGCSNDELSGKYTYVINATRTDNVIPPGYPIVYMYYQVTPRQNLTWYKSVGPERPLLIESIVTNDVADYTESDGLESLNTCENYSKIGWPHVVLEVIRKSVLLGGDCRVKKGSYIIDQDVPPITGIFSEMLPCGDYTIFANGEREGVWAFQLLFGFEIPDGDNCIQQ